MRRIAAPMWCGFRSGRKRRGPSHSTRGWNSRSSAPLLSTLAIRWATITSWRSHSDREGNHRFVFKPRKSSKKRDQKSVTAIAREQSLESEDFPPGQQVASLDSARMEADTASPARENCRGGDDRRIEYPLARARDTQNVSVGHTVCRRRRCLLHRDDECRVSLALI